jgi:hypothetical protein
MYLITQTATNTKPMHIRQTSSSLSALLFIGFLALNLKNQMIKKSDQPHLMTIIPLLQFYRFSIGMAWI